VKFASSLLHDGKSRLPVRALLLALFATGLSGCGDSRLPCIPAKVELVLDGEPFGPANVAFYRVGAKPNDRSTTAAIEKSGDGQASTYRLGDGIPEGEYKVTVSSGAIGRSPVAKAYGSESTTPLKATVFANTDVIKLELEPVKSSAKGAAGLERLGAKSNEDLLQEAMSPQN
jgi:hypothetical protein